MNGFYLFNVTYLIPAALIGVIVAIVLLVKRRKKDGVRPPHAGGFLVAAILLFVFAGITIVLIPLIHYIILFFRFGTELFYAGLKSL